MMWYRSIAVIESDWHEMLDYSIEAGDSPLLDLGISDNILNGMIGLLALKHLAPSGQHPLAHCILTAGGGSVMWLWALADAQDMYPVDRLTSTFTGVDPATHMASLTTHMGPGGRSDWAPKAAMTGLPIALRWLIFPQMEPSAISPWQALPLTISIERPLMDLPHRYEIKSQPIPLSTLSASNVAPKPSADESDFWLIGSALIMCLLIVLVALWG
ncbi:MAG: hypothetical protein AAF702_35575 [Chloroflexota bacterium]